MCGIAGFVNNSGLNQSLDSLIGMLSAIRHRGPDAAGIFIDDYAAIGHVRLSIIDLAGGNQPVHNETKTIWVTYNGEIYNYPELRRYLIQKGHAFSTMTDTEVIVHLYEEEGIDFLNKLNGQWAFALWDRVKKRLFLARDRVGVRPIYYTVCDGALIFASEIKAIFTLHYIDRSIDPIALDQIFTFWTTLQGKTFFTGIEELPPGHFILKEQTGLRLEKYWEIPLYPSDRWETGNPDELTEQVRELLVDAVRIRLRADVPVGTYLSGGLDSSGVTSIVAKKFNPDVQTFGIRFDEERFDEGRYQHDMVRYLNVRHREISAENTAIGDSFIKAVWHCEKPILRTAPVPLYLLARLVRETGIKVVLTGEGADEFHGGYDIFKEALIRRFWGRCPDSAWRGKLIERLYSDIFYDERTRKYVSRFFGKNIDKYGDPLFSHLIRWNNTSRIKTFFSPSINSAINCYDGIAACRRSLPEGFDSWHLLHKAQYLEISIFMSNYLLSSQGDRMGMAHSIEVRMPYLDHRLLDLMGRVPPWWKICGLHEKHLLKKALAPFLPASITARVKHPYRAPMHRSLLALANSDEGREILAERAIMEAGLFDRRKVNGLLGKLSSAESASETDAMALAGIISAQVIWRGFVHLRPEIVKAHVRLDVLVDNRTIEN
ncbi:MAG: asparagine synthase (glutamine-hydrolyzing) [Chitinispirillaceae bacterium]|nr:asparagine synthase (glutamine-hydrolyzing) [Chitinispirillaceae bacterium]